MDDEALEAEQAEAEAPEENEASTSDLAALIRKNQELLAENKRIKSREKKRLLETHSFLTEEDVKGLSIDRVDALVRKVLENAGTTPPPVEVEPPDEKPPASPQIDAAKAFAKTAARNTTPPTEELMAADEWLRLLRKNPAEGDRLAREGKVAFHKR